MFAIIGICEEFTIGRRSRNITTRVMASSNAGGASGSPTPHGLRRSNGANSEQSPRSSRIVADGTTGPRSRATMMRATRMPARQRGELRTRPVAMPRSHQRHQERSPPRKPADALPELPQPNGNVRRKEPPPQVLARPALGRVVLRSLHSRIVQLVERQTLNLHVGGSSPSPGATALSSRGLGRCPLTAVTRVRIPLGQ